MSDVWSEFAVRDLASSGRVSFTDGDWIETPHIRDNGIRLIQTGNIGIGEFINDSKKYISQKSFEELNCKEVFPGDLRICRLAEPIGRVCFAPNLGQRMITSVDVTIFRADLTRFEPRFISYCLNTPEFLRKCENVSGGTTRQRISRSNLGALRIRVPDLDAQKQIAEVLISLDNAIEQAEALIAKTQQIKSGLMHDLFTRGVTPNGELRPPRSEAPQLYKESPLRWIPKEWTAFIIDGSDIAIIDGDRGEQYPQAHELLDFGDCLFLSATNVTKAGFVFEVKQFVTREKDRKLRTGKLVRGDIVVTTRGTVGNIAYYDATIPFPDVRINSGMILLRSCHVGLQTKFLYTALQNYIFEHEYKRVVSGSAQPQLPIKDLKRFNMLLPAPDEQERIVSRVEAMLRYVASEEEHVEKLQSTKRGLMHDLLTGRVGVTVSDAQKAAANG